MFAPHPEPPLWAWLLFGAFEFAIRVVALGVVPKHRRASTSTAWLLLIFLWPLLGVPLYAVTLWFIWLLVAPSRIAQAQAAVQR